MTITHVSGAAGVGLPAAVGDPLEIAIVGMGPRGLSVLERLMATVAARRPDRPVRIFAVDPGEPGAGRVWRTDQPEWLVMNTPAGEVTMYSADPDGGPARAGAGPSLHEWLSDHPDSRWSRLGPNDFAPRAVYGEYLTDVFHNVVSNPPPNVTVHPVRAEVTSLRRNANGYLLITDGEPKTVAAHKVVLTTGHSPDTAQYEEFDRIQATDTVAIVGMGLTFYDILASLTEGRGGTFEDDGERLRYRPSGREPLMVAGSRSGLPMPARGRNQKSPHYRFQPRFLTGTALADARTKRSLTDGNPQLDFREDVLPLILLEVEHVYYTAHVRRLHGEDAAARFAEAHQQTCSTTGLLDEFGVAHVPPIDLPRLARPFADRRFASPGEFHDHLLSVLRADIAEASLGNVDGPLKAALDTLRDMRGRVRDAVDFGGLRPESHRDFLADFGPVNSLLSVGPPVTRLAQTCALIESGLLTVAGPGTVFEQDGDRIVVVSPQVDGSRREATVLIDARVPKPALPDNPSPLIQQLLDDGLISEFVNGSFATGGLAVTPAPLHVVDATGRANPDIHALGVPTENARWFTQIGNDRPGPMGGFSADADAIAAGVLTPAYQPQATPRGKLR